ncbi:aldo/keto reductase [Alkalibacter rhizosphaerae]|uniref:Aldo/keto reductase n=1 Tax=Alkalibacter rhizosphaerae TaxID=2815577 RepID=A0A975AIG6_9FIRM|nr:aldo/keto reductase [Alkalibacter rhizosphaerae]QSX08664.1 aldo/keto reductase [Alkalibacter rhizosphaerae]
MHYIQLGQTDLTVSKLAFGTLTMGPLQANLSREEGALLLERAWDLGINFLDTADLYQNYDHIKEGLKRTSRDWILASKSYDYTWKAMKDSLEKARKGLDRDMIDIWMLHETESVHTIRGHWEAVECLMEAKQKGLIRHIGISTHHVAGVYGAMEYPEIGVIHPIFNKKGLGIADGSFLQMEEALRKAHDRGKGIFAMKPLGGGHLIKDRREAFRFVLEKEYIHSMAVGMQTVEEVEYNAALVAGRPVSHELSEKTEKQNRHLHIDSWCEGCGNCVAVCPQKALRFEDGQARVDRDACILCGYCAAVCPQFCIKVV